LLPLKRALTEVEHDVQDTHVAMDQVLSSDDLLQALCLENDELASPVAENSTHRDTGEEGGSPNSNLRQATADMLLTYQREVMMMNLTFPSSSGVITKSFVFLIW
jgi:magnesium transporter